MASMGLSNWGYPCACDSLASLATASCDACGNGDMCRIGGYGEMEMEKETPRKASSHRECRVIILPNQIDRVQ